MAVVRLQLHARCWDVPGTSGISLGFRGEEDGGDHDDPLLSSAPPCGPMWARPVLDADRRLERDLAGGQPSGRPQQRSQRCAAAAADRIGGRPVPRPISW